MYSCDGAGGRAAPSMSGLVSWRGRGVRAIDPPRRRTGDAMGPALTGVGQAEISRIEAGKANPTQETLCKPGASLGAVLTFATEDGRPIPI